MFNAFVFGFETMSGTLLGAAFNELAYMYTSSFTAGFLARSWVHKVHTRRNPIHAHMEISEFGMGRPDFGGRRPRGEALGQKTKNRIV